MRSLTWVTALLLCVFTISATVSPPSAATSMHADARKLLWDAQQAAGRISRFTAGKTFADYQADEFLRSAVERQFEVIGEALSQL